MGFEREQLGKRTWLCPWDDCEWEYVETHTAAAMLGAYYGADDPRHELAAELATGALQKTEEAMRRHMDDAHPGWTMEEVGEHSRRNTEKLNRKLRQL